MSLETRPLHPTLACEVAGLRLWEQLDPDTIAELRALWSRRGVLVFRRQALSETELARFCAHFGPLERTIRSDWASRQRCLSWRPFGLSSALIRSKTSSLTPLLLT